LVDQVVAPPQWNHRSAGAQQGKVATTSTPTPSARAGAEAGASPRKRSTNPRYGAPTSSNNMPQPGSRCDLCARQHKSLAHCQTLGHHTIAAAATAASGAHSDETWPASQAPVSARGRTIKPKINFNDYLENMPAQWSMRTAADAYARAGSMGSQMNQKMKRFDPNTHIGPTYVCACGKVFDMHRGSQKGNIERHQRSCGQMRPSKHICNGCGREFSQRVNRDRHERSCVKMSSSNGSFPPRTVRVFGRNLHSRMPLDPTHVRLKRTRV
jgi:hypothetical protein